MSSDEDGRRGHVGGEDIAIVGMACLFPGAPDLDAYWNNILSKKDCVTDPPAESWQVGVFYDPASDSNDRVYCKRGGFIDPLASFDPVGHGVMPRAVEGGEPDQWLALEVARAALLDAGYRDEIPERRRTAVILGKGTYLNRGNAIAVQHGRVVDQTIDILRRLHPEYSEAELQEIRRDLKACLPPFSADTAAGLIPNIVAGRIANRLDLMGPNYTVDAACASSLVALEHAIRGLRSRDFDLALVGGVHVATPVPTLMLFCQLGALSRHERIRPFDAAADGTILGAGLGMVVVKRLADALRDGQRVYAVVKGVGLASDGRGLSVTAPRLDGEVTALRRAYESAGISPSTVGLIEAHGTGTPVGDVTEVQALREVLGPREEAPPRCALGSVKSMISHLMPAAGIAGLIKVALSLYHKVLPPTLNVETPNPRLELDRTKLYLNTETRPWIHGTHDTPRRAGLNAFGFGGVNGHAIVEEYVHAEEPTTISHPMTWDSEVVLLAAASRAELIERTREVRRVAEADPAPRLLDLAYTLNVPLGPGPVRAAVVASTTRDLAEKLGRLEKRLGDPACAKVQDVQGVYFFQEPLASKGELAFVFPGEGSQYTGMLADLCIHFPEVRKSFDLMDRIFARHSRNFVPSDLVFPPPAFSDAERAAAEERLWQMEGAFETVLTASWALFLLLGRLGIRPDSLLGHSTGEYTAMLASGMIRLTDESRIAQFANELNGFYHERLGEEGGIPRAALVAVGADAATVSEIARGAGDRLHVAMDNCPHQTVVAGAQEDVERFVEELNRRGLIYERLRFDRPYHTPWFRGCAEGLRGFLSSWITSGPRTRTYSCASIAPFPEEPGEILDLAVSHWRRPVEFRKTVEAMHRDGIRIFVEVGPRGNLSAFVDDILRDRPHLAVPADVVSRSGISQIHHLVGLLGAHGAPVDLDPLYARRSPRRVPLGPATRVSAEAAAPGGKPGRRIKLALDWTGMNVTADTAARLGSRRPPATTPPVAPHPEPAPTLRGAPAEAEQVLSSHLRTMEKFLAVQQEVMETYLRSRRDAFEAARGEERVPGARIEERDAVPSESAARSSASEAVPARAAIEASAGSTEAGAAPAAAGGAAPEALRDQLLRLVSERTGYPVEMLGLDLNLEADLGIDSIKRVEILGSFRQQADVLREEDMEELSSRRTLREILEVLERRAASAVTVSREQPASRVEAAATPRFDLPLLGKILSFIPGKELVAERELSPADGPILLDHTLCRAAAETDPELRGLPVVALTVAMEMLAEAAAPLAPSLRLIGMRDVRAHRWMALEDGRLRLRLVARVRPSPAPAAVAVEIFELREDRGGAEPEARPVIEGTMHFGDAYPDAPRAGPFALTEDRASSWTRERLYQEGMFHGPRFRGVASIDRCGTDGAEATLEVRPEASATGTSVPSGMLTDPILLDQPGQVVGFWMAESFERGIVVFPFHVEALELYGPALPAGERVRCLARIALIGEHRVKSDLDVVRNDGRVWARFVGWEDRRFDVPAPFLGFLRAPREVVLSESWSPPIAWRPGERGVSVSRASRDDFPADFLTAHGGIWRKALAHAVLGRREREEWLALALDEPGRLGWLLQRLVAKDAVRRWLRQRHGLALCPADIEISLDDAGRPVASGAWSRGEIAPPLLSVDQSDGVAVAVVTENDSVAGLGVHVERVGLAQPHDGSRESAAADVVRPEAGPDGGSVPGRCAMRAIAKSLGQDDAGARKHMIVESLDLETGTVHVRLEGDLAKRFPRVDRGSLLAYAARRSDLVVAVSVYPGPESGA